MVIRVGSSSSSMDHEDLVYKVDSPVQSSLLSSLVLTVIAQGCGQTSGRVRIRIVVIISLQWTKG